ncbi:MAG TPA: glycosyltransferase family 2 protein [Bacteroidales bacterium]|nr:glycosyltransferase family 2 protein [Bacteroidales bacterium]HPS15952.1 glycosyltransferase family 2 protein [Bacteroidales bacterium]
MKSNSDNNYNICILLPFYNDWDSMNELLKQIDELGKTNKIGNYKIIAVNDCSTQQNNKIEENIKIEIINLNRNVGHQKAIAIGLAYINENVKTDAVVVMDADGEDNPEDIIRLYENIKNTNYACISFASRRRRKEKSSFKFFYFFYKIIFKLLTGEKITFGNFSIIPSKLLSKLVYMPEISVHYSGAVIKSKLPYNLVLCNRNKRYFGKSKMNLSSLVLHGLSSISVHFNTVATRLLIFSVVSIFIIILAMLSILGVKIFTDMAIPGWTSNMIFLLLILGIEIFIICVFLIFQILFQKNKFDEFVPAIHYKSFVDTIN